MRDPASIDPIIERLRRLWKARPDLRLGQIVGNAYSVPQGEDPYYDDDETFISALENANGRRNA